MVQLAPLNVDLDTGWLVVIAFTLGVLVGWFLFAEKPPK